MLRRADYEEPAHWITAAYLGISFPKAAETPATATRVESKLTLQANDGHHLETDDLILDGDYGTLSLLSVSIKGHASKDQDSHSNHLHDDEDSFVLLQKDKDYQCRPKDNQLVVFASALRAFRPWCVLKVVVELDPFGNQGLEGLYHRDGMYCTHCEPSAFRKITFFQDRPDNCAVFTVRIEASKVDHPILLSNGNLVESGPVEEDRHYALFEDPHPKPCYAFGVVAASTGTLKCLQDIHITSSGKRVRLSLYAAPERIPHLSFAMDTLKRALAWEEETYGLEYDLDTYNIVATDHFSIGAMENKGLNLFLASLIATDPDSTTDVTYDLVEKTVSHECFHNWSGNRVTVRDWFEFALKEGLTVYRDQEFTADSRGRTAVRIDAVRILREKQFAEDASPGRHSIRPEVYASPEQGLESLATSTTYHKGAEVRSQGLRWAEIADVETHTFFGSSYNTKIGISDVQHYTVQGWLSGGISAVPSAP